MRLCRGFTGELRGERGRTAAIPKRQEVKLLLKRLKKDNPDIEKERLQQYPFRLSDTMPGLEDQRGDARFLEHYDRE